MMFRSGRQMDARLQQRNCCSSTLRPMLGTALLTLLAMGAPLHAQAGEGLAAPEFLPPSLALHSEPPAPGNKPREVSKTEPPAEMLLKSRPADFNRSIYYKNKLEFSLETGWLPNNIPFVFDR